MGVNTGIGGVYFLEEGLELLFCASFHFICCPIKIRIPRASILLDKGWFGLFLVEVGDLLSHNSRV